MSSRHERVILACCLAAQAMLVASAAWFAHQGAPPSRVVLVIALMFVPYAGALVISRGSEGMIRSPWVAPSVCAFLGLVLVLAPPVLSDDLYRYLWEGRLWLEGINPYRVPPADPSLAPLRDALWEPINNKQLASIYPPLMQGLFILSALLGGQVWTIKLLALFGLLVAVIAVGRVSGSQRPALALALNPLMLSETALNGHFDVLVGAMLLLAAWWLGDQRFFRAALATCTALGLKVLGLILLPLFGRRPVAFALVSCASGILLLPLFVSRTPLDPVSGTGQFAMRWEGNDSLFALVRWVSEQVVDAQNAGLVARAVVGLLFCGLVLFALRNRVPPLRAVRALTWAVLLLSPQVHPWYLGWLLPLELVAGGRAGVVWSVLVLAAYAPLDRFGADGVWHLPVWVQCAEYALLGLALLFDPLRPAVTAGGNIDEFSSNSGVL